MARRDDDPRQRTLPVISQPPPERADAARNRRAILDAAHVIMSREGVAALSMDRVAEAAHVGVGTVYRRFGDRGGLAHALLDERERQFQQAVLNGSPPLGPGAPPTDRIRAFLHAYVDRLETEAELHALGDSQAPTARFGSGAYQVARAHITTLLSAAGCRTDISYLADALLATVSAAMFLHQRRERGFSAERIKSGIDSLLSDIVPGERR